jgi:hypothetical protein
LADEEESGSGVIEIPPPKTLRYAKGDRNVRLSWQVPEIPDKYEKLKQFLYYELII